MTKKFKNLKQSLASTMAGIASKAGLKLAFGKPRTNGKTVWVSDIPLNPSEDDYYSVVSDLIHEIGHIKYTDFSLDRKEHHLMPALSNVFEDVRIEKELQREFLGAKDFLEEGYKVIQARGQQVKPDTPANAFTTWLFFDHMVKENGREFWIPEREQSYDACITFGIDSELLDEVEALCDSKVPKLNSTADVIDLSREVIELLKQSQPEEQDPQPKPDSQDSEPEDSNDGDESDSSDNSQQDSNSGNSDGSNDPEDDSDDGANGQDANASDQSESDDQQVSDSNSNGSSKSGAKEIMESDVREQSPISLREEAQKVEGNVDQDNSAKAQLGNSQDIAVELRQNNGSGSRDNYYADTTVGDDMPAYTRIKSQHEGEIQRLRRDLIKRWQNQSKTRQRVNEFDGRFDCGEAIRCRVSGENNYLVKKAKTTNHKPAVCILADLSGSMNNSGKITTQAAALIAVAEACNAVGLPLNIIGFSDYAVNVKDWNMPMPKVRAKLGGMSYSINCTEITKAVFEGIKALSVRKEQKKILITMTDGAIGNDTPTVQNLLAFAEKHVPGEFESYGIGIGTHIGSIFSKGGCIDPKNMAQSILNILSQ
ncbi:hypothetical protein [Hydrogenovibrio marinus]|uniref:VWFA domain-containing protein n=1 Tax=Hydrogenovibrio marinus TaxID=28885 RepID=A0A066ZQU5_HYDMR|nr:hypothetical protein [Hydrogenovibrio marinus]KDN94634.1 hypothetical protein EI16_12090 [Hydrogenovibrio marinus]